MVATLLPLFVAIKGIRRSLFTRPAALISLVTISSPFHEQLLFKQIPKAQKDTGDLTVFLPFLGPACVKAALKNVGEMDPWCTT